MLPFEGLSFEYKPVHTKQDQSSKDDETLPEGDACDGSDDGDGGDDNGDGDDGNGDGGDNNGDGGGDGGAETLRISWKVGLSYLGVLGIFKLC